jgi:hypothetical protein
LTAPGHADRAERLRAEAAVLLRFLDEPGHPSEPGHLGEPAEEAEGA